MGIEVPDGHRGPMGIAVLRIEPFSFLGQFSLPAVFRSANVWCAEALPSSAAAVWPTDGSQLSLSSLTMAAVLSTLFCDAPTPGTADVVSVCGLRAFLRSEMALRCLSEEEVLQFQALHSWTASACFLFCC